MGWHGESGAATTGGHITVDFLRWDGSHVTTHHVYPTDDAYYVTDDTYDGTVEVYDGMDDAPATDDANDGEYSVRYFMLVIHIDILLHR